MVEKNSIGFTDSRQKGVLGRRRNDEHVCVMHDYITDKNDQSFIGLDEKFSRLEQKLESYVSKWAFRIIMSMFISVSGGVFAIGVWQLDHIDKKLSSLADNLVALNSSVLVVGTVQKDVVETQRDVVETLKTLAPEHLDLMKHLETTGRERELRRMEFRQQYRGPEIGGK